MMIGADGPIPVTATRSFYNEDMHARPSLSFMTKPISFLFIRKRAIDKYF
jgi:hypothetical protein